MKFLRILVLMISLSLYVNAQTVFKATLSGSIYDMSGALIPDIKVMALNQKGEKFYALTNQEGVYTLDLPYTKYEVGLSNLFKIAKYEITVDGINIGFQKYTIKDFNFVGRMQLDFALDVNPFLRTIQKEPIQENKKQNKIKRKNNK